MSRIGEIKLIIPLVNKIFRKKPTYADVLIQAFYIYLSEFMYSVTWEGDILKGQSDICTLLSGLQGVMSVMSIPGTAYYSCRICISHYCTYMCV